MHISAIRHPAKTFRCSERLPPVKKEHGVTKWLSPLGGLALCSFGGQTIRAAIVELSQKPASPASFELTAELGIGALLFAGGINWIRDYAGPRTWNILAAGGLSLFGIRSFVDALSEEAMRHTSTAPWLAGYLIGASCMIAGVGWISQEIDSISKTST